MDRKTFLKVMAAASVAQAASDRIRTGIIGPGGRGQYLMGEFKTAGAEMAAVCEVYEPNIQEALKVAPEARVYGDYRRLLEDKSIDAVIIATPDHWHSRMAIDAMEAGKDVYLEKPIAHTIEEGFQLVDAVRRTSRILQVGLQRHSSELFVEAKKIMDSGAAGEIRLVTSWWLNTTKKALTARPLEGKLDWERWLGPAPRRELDPRRFFEWTWFYDYGGGVLTNNAVHLVDAINWLMGSTYPLAVTATGRVDIQGVELPETASMTIEHEGYIAIVTVGHKAMRYKFAGDQCKQFHGSKARFDVGREFFSLYPEDDKTLDLKPSKGMHRPGLFLSSSGAHVRNFLDCVRSRKEPNCTIERGQAASVISCMAVESYRQGRRIRYDAALRRMI